MKSTDENKTRNETDRKIKTKQNTHRELFLIGCCVKKMKCTTTKAIKAMEQML